MFLSFEGIPLGCFLFKYIQKLYGDHIQKDIQKDIQLALMVALLEHSKYSNLHYPYNL